jgi:hypothetical protein
VARDALCGDGTAATADGWTVARWLRYWLTTGTEIRPTTLRSYQIHVERHLIPHLGRIRLSDLAGRQITDMITTVGSAKNRRTNADTVDFASDQGDVAVSLERRRPGGPAARQSSLLRRGAVAASSARAGVDRAAGRSVEADRRTTVGRCMGHGADRDFPTVRGRIGSR